MKSFTLEHIVHTVRDRIEEAINNDDRRLLSEIATALTIIHETFDKSDNKDIWLILIVLIYVAREGSMGFYIKERLPSHEEITEAFR